MTSIANPKTCAALVARFRALRPDAARRWGTMTAHEMVCHLGDAAAGVLVPAGGASPKARPFFKWIALYSPFPWPKGKIRAPAAIDPRAQGTRPEDFERDRERAVAGLLAIAAAGPGALRSGFGLFGRMTSRDWQRWAYRHSDHHLRQFGV